MRVIQTPPPDIDATTLEAFRRHLVKRDLAPATVTAYLDDINRFWTWLCSRFPYTRPIRC